MKSRFLIDTFLVLVFIPVKIFTLSAQPDTLVWKHPSGEIYQVGKFGEFWLGRNYRKEWVTLVQVPVFTFYQQSGKLTVSEIGGNAQTKTIRLRNASGYEWVLRSVDKNPAKAIPDLLRTEMVEDIIQDQMSATNPYAALAVPRLAEAAGIYHTNPSIVFLNQDSIPITVTGDLEGLYLFEERPDGDHRYEACFGFSPNIIGTSEMLKKVTEDPKYKVDQEYFLKARLLDMVIGDWDRHEDQWRWATLVDQRGDKFFRAIPRDRDMTFFISQGVLPWLSSRRFLLRKAQGFKPQIHDIAGLNYNARYLDRRFLTELELEDWLRAASEIRMALSDTILENAVKDMPPQIFQLNGTKIITNLKVRRDRLEHYATKYYRILAKQTDIVGTENDELFSVIRTIDKKVQVKISTAAKEGRAESLYYDRVFTFPDTHEIRLYGLDGSDQFKISGEVGNTMKIRIVSGKGKDEVTDYSQINGFTRKTLVYRNTEKHPTPFGQEVKSILTPGKKKYSYQYNSFKYNKFIPLMFAGYNPDDGLFSGTGFVYITHGFMKDPFAMKHQLRFQYAKATQASELRYHGIFTEVSGNMDLQINAMFRRPKYSLNFFGFGNESPRDSFPIPYYRVRTDEILVYPEILFPVTNKTRFAAGPFYQNSKIQRNEKRFISNLAFNDLDSAIFERNQYVGLSAGFMHDSRNHEIWPTKGIHWETKNMLYYNLKNEQHVFNQVTATFSYFTKVILFPETVFAFRAGAAYNAGEYDLIRANTLGGKSNLRGFRDGRFAGDKTLYFNSELRMKLSNVKSYITKGYFGILTFYDLGRLWYSGEVSRLWHQGYGAGLWVSPYEMAIVTINYERSSDENAGFITIRFGFFF